MNLQDHRVFITGATGFVGSMLAKELCNRGIEVHILRREKSHNPILDALPVRHHIGNVLDAEAVRTAMEHCTAVFHCAGLVSFWRSLRHKQYNVNVQGTEVVASAALQLGIQRFVHTSSVAALGPEENGDVVTEDSPFQWDKYNIGYNISKRDAELRVIEKIEKGLDAVIVNPSTIIGPGDVNMHGTAIVSNVLAKRLPFYIETPMDVVDIDDVVEGHIRAFEKGKTGERYILSGHSLPAGELFQRIEQIAGGRAPRKKIPISVASCIAAFTEIAATIFGFRPPITKELLRAAKHRQKFSCAKAERELGYTRTPLDETIRKTAEWLRNSGRC